MPHKPLAYRFAVCGVLVQLSFSSACTSSLDTEFARLNASADDGGVEPADDDSGQPKPGPGGSGGGGGAKDSPEPPPVDKPAAGGTGGASEPGGGSSGDPAQGAGGTLSGVGGSSEPTGSGGSQQSTGGGGGSSEPPGGAGGEVACVPDCAGAQCGDDGCGTSCGECALGSECQVGQCVGSYVFEVENAALTGQMRANSGIMGFSGSGYGDCVDLECGFTISPTVSGGTYYMDVTYTLAATPRRFAIEVNGTPWIRHTFRTTANWRDDSLVGLVLQEGVNTIKFSSDGTSGPNVDRVSLKPDDGSRFQVRVEAELATSLGCAETKLKDGGTIIAACPPNSVSTYSVDVPKNGPVTFTFRSATVHGNAKMQLLDAADVVLAESDTLSGTWDTFRTYSIRTTPLTAGVQILKLRNAPAEMDTNWWSINE